MPLLWVSLSFIGGILIAAALAGADLRLPCLLWTGLAIIPPAVGLVLRSRGASPGQRNRGISGWLLRPLPRLAIPPAILAAALLLGAARYEAARPRIDANHVAWLNGKGPAVISGWISAPVEPGGKTTLVRLKVETAGLAGEDGNASLETARGTVLVRLPGSKPWSFGDRLTIRGALQEPPVWDGFSYRDYLARQGVYAWVPYGQAELDGSGAGSPILCAVYRLRQRLYAGIQHNFPAPESELLAGILLGIEGGIPEVTAEAFKVTGTAHIIAISGFNMAVIAGLLSILFTRLAGARRGLLLTLAGLAFYTILAGASASVIRAAVMGSLGLYGRQIGRRQAGVNSLMFTALMMCLINPNWLWDVGFQLSFAATLGLILYAGPLEALALRLVQARLPQQTARRVTRFIAEYFLLTLAAQVITLPVMAFHFGRLSLTSFLVNPLILPAQPPVMILGGLAALLDLVSRPLAGLAAATAWPFLAYTIHIVEGWARIPGASLYTGQASIWLALLYYAVLTSLTLLCGRLAALRPTLRPALILLVTAALALAVWRQVLALPPVGRLVLEVLPDGENSALLLHTPGGRSLLIGAGGDQTRLAAETGRRLPLWGDHLDGMIITDPAGLAQTVAQYRPNWALWMEDSRARNAEDLKAALVRTKVREADAVPGQAIDLGDGALLEILGAGGDEPAMRITWQNFSVLVLANRARLPDGLGVPDAGLVVILGEEEKDSLAQEFERARILRAPPDGWLRIATDGSQMWLDQSR